MKRLLLFPALFAFQILFGQRTDLIKFLDAYKTADLSKSKETIYDYSFIHDKQYEYNLNILYYSHIEGYKFKTDIPNINGYKAIVTCKLKNGPKEYIDKELMVIMYYDSVAKHYSVFNMRDVVDTKKEYQKVKNIAIKIEDNPYLAWWAIMAGQINDASQYNKLAIPSTKKIDYSIETFLKRIKTSKVSKTDEMESIAEKDSILKLQDIEGIGKFILNKTPIIYLNTFAKENNLDRQRSIYSWEEYRKFRYKSNAFAEVFPDTISPYMSGTYNASYCKQVRVFYIPKMTIANIEINDAFFTFYNDTLVRISTSYSPEILDAFEIKYGKPRISENMENVKCTSKLTGEEKTYQESHFSSYWINRNIHCIASIDDYYNSDCEKSLNSHVVIYLEPVRSKIRECNDEEEKLIETLKKDNNKNKLKNF